MQIKNNKLSGLFYFLMALVPTIRQLWRRSKQVQEFTSMDLDYRISRLTAMQDVSLEELLIGRSNLEASPLPFGAADLLEFAILDFEELDFDVVYTFNRTYEIISWPVIDEATADTANCYVYSFDQRRENIRKLGKPALGLSPPFLS